jgi:hypothetical protein
MLQELSKLAHFPFYFSMFQCDEMLVCEGVGRIQNESSEVKCSLQASAIPQIVLHMHTDVLIPKLIIIFKIPMM